MFLALDIGNSTIGAAVFDGGTIRATLSAPSTVQRTGEELWQVFTSFFSEHAIHSDQIEQAGISSVVPFLSSLLTRLLKERLGVDPTVISGEMDCGIRIHYKKPALLGPDRICGAVAGFARHGGPLIVIDFGTATTFNAVNAEGDFLGGAISFGVKSQAEALSQRTAQLPRIDLQEPSRAINTDTVSAMQAGTMFGAIDAVEGMIRRMKKELGGVAAVIATGGLSSTMAANIPPIDAVEPHLVLEGVRIICERVRRA